MEDPSEGGQTWSREGSSVDVTRQNSPAWGPVGKAGGGGPSGKFIPRFHQQRTLIPKNEKQLRFKRGSARINVGKSLCFYFQDGGLLKVCLNQQTR